MSGRIEVAGLTIDRAIVPHPLLGEAHTISQGDRVLTHMTPLDWDRPTQIPAIAAPGALPPGTGGAILNLIAERALAAGVPALRYAGPYPTPALYRALLRSFRASADEATFTRDLVERASTLARDEIAIDFAPAPHRRVPHAHGMSEVRDGLERTTIDGVVYERDTTAPARLVRGTPRVEFANSGVPGDAYQVPTMAAQVWFGDRLFAHVAVLDEDGTLVEGPEPIPPMTSSVIGARFPPPLVAALAELLVDYVPLSSDEIAKLFATVPIVWADLGARAASRRREGGIAIHAAIWEHIAPLGLPRVAAAIAEALAPMFTSSLVEMLQALPSLRPTP
ncbi:MAG TPA: hypothetical protein VMZ53_31585 [Kofleriaceae bacterium]|nr:hypothetical protein [Kofleriaceae bacterium]